MTSQTISERCQGGQPQGVKGQPAVAPNFSATLAAPHVYALDHYFHCAQARLKSNAKRASFSGQKAVARSFCPTLTGIEAATPEDRLHEYAVKKAALNACKIDMDHMSAVRAKVMQRIEMNRVDERRKAA